LAVPNGKNVCGTLMDPIGNMEKYSIIYLMRIEAVLRGEKPPCRRPSPFRPPLDRRGRRLENVAGKRCKSLMVPFRLPVIVAWGWSVARYCH
jgi:hypothetical protein